MIIFFVGIILLRIFSPWFLTGTISAGDWPYLFREQIIQFHWLPEPRFLWLAPWYQILTKLTVQYMGIPWDMVERFFWFLPFIFLSLFSSYKLTKSLIGALIYTTNTYVLMIVGGGQMGVAMAYAIAPLVLSRLIDKKNLIVNGFLLSVQIMFDPRIAILTLIASVIFYIIQYNGQNKFSILPICFSTGIATILNFYWVVPLLRSQLPLAQQLGEATSGAVKYLSFATFEQTLSLLHPNWPDNIFGKVYFMRPEFLIVPIVAFAALLIKPMNRKILYFSLLALVGAFLAKGTNAPFGGIYDLLFNLIPGFTMFRDPTKFYLFTSLSLSVLIPFVIQKIDRKKIISVVFILFWTFTIRQALSGQLTGTFRPAPVPAEYIRLKDFLNTQSQAFQTLWIPERQRFGYSSRLHPSLDARELSGESSISGMLQWLSQPDTQGDLVRKHVTYIIVPYDSRGELFLTDRKYDKNQYKDTYKAVESFAWVRQISTFSAIGVFEIPL